MDQSQLSHLNLQHSRLDLTVSQDPLNHADVKVGDADGFGQAQLLGFLHALPGIYVVYDVETALIWLEKKKKIKTTFYFKYLFVVGA